MTKRCSLRPRPAFPQARLDGARRRPVEVEPIAFDAPLVQVLSLDRPSADQRPATRRRESSVVLAAWCRYQGAISIPTPPGG